MAALNFSEINADYWSGAIKSLESCESLSRWQRPGRDSFVRLQRKMGYRLRLVDATFPTSATAGAVSPSLPT